MAGTVKGGMQEGGKSPGFNPGLFYMRLQSMPMNHRKGIREYAEIYPIPQRPSRIA